MSKEITNHEPPMIKVPLVAEFEMTCSDENANELTNIMVLLPDIKLSDDMSVEQRKTTMLKIIQTYKSNKSLPEFKISLLTVIFAYISFIMYLADYLSDAIVAYDH